VPAGEVRAGEHWLLDASLRIPLITAGSVFSACILLPPPARECTCGRREIGTPAVCPHTEDELVTGDPDVMIEQLETALALVPEDWRMARERFTDGVRAHAVR
jgi:hypothetical protein